MESNHLMPPYQEGATRSALPEWIPAGGLNSPVNITAAADRALARNKTKWSPALKSNQLIRFTRPAHRRQCLQGVPMLGRHRSKTPAFRPVRKLKRAPPSKNGARGENRTLLASLEGWNSTNEPLPRLCIYMIVKELWSGTCESNAVSSVPKTDGFPISQSP